MPIKIDDVYVRGDVTQRTLAKQQPPDLEKTIADYRTQNKEEIAQAESTAKLLEAEAAKLEKEAAQLKAEAKKLRSAGKVGEAKAKSAAAKEKLDLAEEKVEEADAARGKFEITTSMISGVTGRDLLLASEGGDASAAWQKATSPEKKHEIALDAFYDSDAGHGMAAAKNATLWIVEFGYGSHEPMRGFLTGLPADKKVTFNVICTPSSHYGSQETDEELEALKPKPGSERANFESNARTNSYCARVLYAAEGASDLQARELAKVSFGIKDPKVPEYASMSPEMTVDLTGLKDGKLIIEGWCTASAGVGGFEETRRTVIDLPA